MEYQQNKFKAFFQVYLKFFKGIRKVGIDGIWTSVGRAKCDFLEKKIKLDRTDDTIHDMSYIGYHNTLDLHITQQVGK